MTGAVFLGKCMPALTHIIREPLLNEKPQTENDTSLGIREEGRFSTILDETFLSLS